MRQGSDEEADDEDEETLQLKLQALEAKLKLKRLQNKKARNQVNGNEIEEKSQGEPLPRTSSMLSSRRNEPYPNAKLHQSKSVGDIQVLLSPERRPIQRQEQRSPGRILLGIDKGISAREVSLKRAPSLRDGSIKAKHLGAELQPANPRTRSISGGHLPQNDQISAPMSFNERMAQVRNREQSERSHKERLSHLRSKQSTRFNVRSEEIAAFKQAAESRATAPQQNIQGTDGRGFSREEILRTATRPAGGLIKRNDSNVSNERHQTYRTSSALSQRRFVSEATSQKDSKGEDFIAPSDVSSTTTDSALFEGFSRTNLSSRVLPHSFISRTLEDKTAVTLPVLLKCVKAPDFQLPPELEEKDVVVFATIATKSEPRAHKQIRPPSKSNNMTTAEDAAAESKANENGNYMVFTLTDLRWTVELFVFRTAFTRWHKLQPGTLIAILNPTIMPPPKGRTDTGRWSFTLDSSDDTVLEIGTAKDLGWCKAKTKDGKDCSDWIDNRKTEFCEFHVNRGVENLRRGRMEVQGMSAPFGPGGRAGGGNGYLNSMRGGRSQKHGKEGGRQFDRSSQSAFFMVPKNASAANLLDAEDLAGWNDNSEEQQRKLFAAKEREREIAQKLGKAGSGAGAEYLRARNGDTTNAITKTGFQDSSSTLEIKTMGLRSNNATKVTLSPLKRKSSTRAMSNGSHEGGTQRKKTRFITEKGIKEAGRDSLGAEEVTNSLHDDDELDIV